MGAALKVFGGDPTHSAAATDVMFPSPISGAVRDDWTDFDAAALADLGYMILPPGTGSMGDMMTPACGTCAPMAAPFIAFIMAGIGGMKRRQRRVRSRQ